MPRTQVRGMAITRIALFLLCCAPCIVCFDYDELEIFDLVEEVNQNFYELIGVEQTASTPEIRKAYRRLSLQLHPDRNKDENAEESFRQMVAVYEVLKDSGKREVYNNVLEHGLPDWRQPVFYYRRVRKLGLLEITVLLMLILTVGHFLVIWSVYFEKRFELEEVIRSRKKKRKTRRTKHRDADDDDEFEELVQEELATVPRPRLTDLIPCKMVKGSVAMVMAVPACALAARERLRERMRPKLEESDEEEEEEVPYYRRRQRVETVPDQEPEMATLDDPVLYNTPLEDPYAEDTAAMETKTLKEGMDWTDADLALLSKAMAKLPGGTPHRWEKIAEMVGRSVNEVTAKSKKMKTGYAISVDPASQGMTANSDTTPAVSDDVMTTRTDWKSSNSSDGPVKKHPGKLQNNKTPSEHTQSDTQNPPKKKIIVTTKDQSHTEDVKVSNQPNMDHRTLKLNNDSCGTENGDASLWSQNEQKIFEWTLNLYPRGTSERWEKMAEHLPSKTKDDCVSRFRYLADIVKKKKRALQSKELSP